VKLTALLFSALVQICGSSAERDVVLRVLHPEWDRESFILVDSAGGIKNFEKEGDAVAEVEQRLKSRQEVWVGPMQVNSSAFAASGYTIREGLDPCVNLVVGAQLLAGIHEPTAEEVKSSRRPWSDYQATLASYFSATTAGQSLAKRIVDQAIARKPLPLLLAVPISSGEYRQAFAHWNQAVAIALRRRATMSLLP